MENDKLLNYQDAAGILSLKINTLYTMVARRQIPHHRIGPRLVRFKRAELEAWLGSHAVPSVEPPRQTQ